ncbi:hypothetical protein GCM10009739_05950 [Microbacterium ulmi]
MAAAALVIALAALAGAPASAAETDAGPGDITVTVPESDAGRPITNAQFRWGLNAESGAGAFAGGCNFLSAGRAGNAGSARVWTAADGLYSATSAAVRIEKPAAGGEYRLASFESRCLDASGRAVSVSSLTSTTANQVVIDQGRGRLVPGAGLEIRWTGSFTVVFYGGMTYWTVTDPVLTLDPAGDGRVTATASGFGTSMDDLSKWVPLPEQSIVLAELRGVDPASDGGFAIVPEYVGVSVPDAGQIERTSENAAYWGSFPASFVEYQKLTGQAGYWLTTGGQRDRAKPATTLYVSYDAAAPIAVTPPAVAGSADEPSNPIRVRPGQPVQLPADVATRLPIGIPLAAATSLPQGPGLVPASAAAALSALAGPLLASALALALAVVAVLNIMGRLPWQRALRAGR